jgi:hypothetical protein
MLLAGAAAVVEDGCVRFEIQPPTVFYEKK